MSSTSVTQENLRKKFGGLTSAQDSIQALSHWIIHHKNHYRQILDSWCDCLKETKSPRMKLTLLYLANDVIQNSKRKGTTVFVDAFKNVLEDAATLCQEDSIKKNVLRLFKIWGERNIYEVDFCEKLNDATGKPQSVAKKPPKPKVDAKFLAEFQPEEVPDVIDELTEYEDEVELKFGQLSHLNLDVTSVDTISQLKDRAGGKLFSQQFEDAADRLEEFVAALEKEVKLRKQLVDLLEKSEIYYDAQMGEAKIVANAYKNFGTRVTSLKKRLDDYKKVLPEIDLSPLPSPSSDAPSPGATPPSDEGVNRDVEDMDVSDSEDGGKIIAAVPTQSTKSSKTGKRHRKSAESKSRKRSSTNSRGSSGQKISVIASGPTYPNATSSHVEQIQSISPNVPPLSPTSHTSYPSPFDFPSSTAGLVTTAGAAPVYTPSMTTGFTPQVSASYTPASSAVYSPAATATSYTPPATTYTPLATTYTPAATTYTPAATPAYNPTAETSTYSSTAGPYTPTVTTVYNPASSVAYTPTVESAPSVFIPPASAVSAYSPTVAPAAPVYTPTVPSAPQPYSPSVASTVAGYTPPVSSVAPAYVPPPAATVAPVYAATAPAATPAYTPTAPVQAQVYTPAASSEGSAYAPVASAVNTAYAVTTTVTPSYQAPVSTVSSVYTPEPSSSYTPTAPQTYTPAVSAPYNPTSSGPYDSTNTSAYSSSTPSSYDAASASFNQPAPSVYTPPAVTQASIAPVPVPVTPTPAQSYTPVASAYEPAPAATYNESYNPPPPENSHQPSYGPSYSNTYSSDSNSGNTYDASQPQYDYPDTQEPASSGEFNFSTPHPEVTRSGTPLRDEHLQMDATPAPEEPADSSYYTSGMPTGDSQYGTPVPQRNTSPAVPANPMQFLTKLISSRNVPVAAGNSTDLLSTLSSLSGTPRNIVEIQQRESPPPPPPPVRKLPPKLLDDERTSGRRVTSTNAFNRNKEIQDTNKEVAKEEDDDEEENITPEEKVLLKKANQSFGIGQLMMQLADEQGEETMEEKEEDAETEDFDFPMKEDKDERFTLPEADPEQDVDVRSEQIPAQKPSAPWMPVSNKPLSSWASVPKQSQAPATLPKPEKSPSLSPSPPPPPPPPPPKSDLKPLSSSMLTSPAALPFAALLLPPPPPLSEEPPPPPPPRKAPVTEQPKVEAQTPRFSPKVPPIIIPPRIVAKEDEGPEEPAKPIQSINRGQNQKHVSVGQPITVVRQLSDPSPSPPAQQIQSIIHERTPNVQRISVVGQNTRSRDCEEPRPVPVLGQSLRIRGPVPGPPPGPPPPTARQLSGSGIRAPGPPPGPPPVSAKRMSSQDSNSTASNEQQDTPTSPEASRSFDTMPINRIPSLVSPTSITPLKQVNPTPEPSSPYPKVTEPKPLRSILKRSKPITNPDPPPTADDFSEESKIPVLGAPSRSLSREFSTDSISSNFPTDSLNRDFSTESPIKVLGSSPSIPKLFPDDDFTSNSNISVIGARGATGHTGSTSPAFSQRSPFLRGESRSPGNRSPGYNRFNKSPSHDQEHSDRPGFKMDYGHGNVQQIDYGHRKPSADQGMAIQSLGSDRSSFQDKYRHDCPDFRSRYGPEPRRQSDFNRFRPEMGPRGYGPRPRGQFRPSFRGRSPGFRPRQPFHY